jgi:hypothetical protein
MRVPHGENWNRQILSFGMVATTPQERPPIFRLAEHDVSKAFKSLNARPDVSKDELATLEFQFLEALEHGKYGIPNLERQICANPALFVQAVALAFRRNDCGTDPDELGVQDAARREQRPPPPSGFWTVSSGYPARTSRTRLTSTNSRPGSRPCGVS